MEDFLIFFTEVWRSFVEQSPLNKVVIGVGLAVPIFGPFLLWAKSIAGIGQKDKTIDALQHLLKQEESIQTSTKEKLQEAQEELNDFLPSRWLKLASEKEGEGYFDLSADILIQGFSRTSADYARVTKRLAEYYSGFINESELAFVESQKYARLCLLFEPSNSNVSSLLEHLLSEQNEVRPLIKVDLEELTHIPVDHKAAHENILRLIERCHALQKKGFYALALPLSDVPLAL